ncbi:hypothetical protein MKEN_00577000 [Mycena kentingensis (nom. inval.)]|nr:hypothetical protein MKEN_00577000 [Mycena kentingensis (nom. inval.)]
MYRRSRNPPLPPALSLPSELTARIFTIYRDEEDVAAEKRATHSRSGAGLGPNPALLVLLAICSAWRTIAFDTATLWSTISFGFAWFNARSPAKRQAMLEFWIFNSKDALLDVQFYLIPVPIALTALYRDEQAAYDTWLSCFAALRATAHRWRSCRTIGSDFPRVDEPRPLLPITITGWQALPPPSNAATPTYPETEPFDTDFTSLAELHINDSWNRGRTSGGRFIESILQRCTNLHRLRIRMNPGIALGALSSEQWSRITTLHLDELPVGLAVYALQSAPCVEYLTFSSRKVDEITDNIRANASSYTVPVPLDSLVTLRLATEADLGLLAHITTPRLTRLELGERLLVAAHTQLERFTLRSRFSLEELYIGSTAMSSVQGIITTVHSFLRQLTLVASEISSAELAEFVGEIASSPGFLPNLERLHLEDVLICVDLALVSQMLLHRRARFKDLTLVFGQGASVRLFGLAQAMRVFDQLHLAGMRIRLVGLEETGQGTSAQPAGKSLSEHAEALAAKFYERLTHCTLDS